MHAENSYVSPAKKSAISPLKNTQQKDQNSLKENRLS